MTARPPLVIVQGSPGSGKSTLSRRLAAALRLPLVSRDELKEAMAEYAPFENLAESERFGLAAVGAFYHVTRQFVANGLGAVLDSAFPRGQAETELALVVEASRAVQIHCAVPNDLARQRYIQRHERGERHACHFDAERIERVLSGRKVIDWSRFDPLDLDVPTLRVDTTDDYPPNLDAVLAFIRDAVSTSASVAAAPDYPKKQMGAGALFFNAGGELLIVKPTYRDHWSIPGGVIEDAESPRAGCTREVREEIGLDVPLGPLLAVDYTSLASGPRESLQFLFYGGTLDTAKIASIALPVAELSEHQFVATEEARTLLNPRLARRLPHALDAIAGRGAAYLEDGTLPPLS